MRVYAEKALLHFMHLPPEGKQVGLPCQQHRPPASRLQARQTHRSGSNRRTSKGFSPCNPGMHRCCAAAVCALHFGGNSFVKKDSPMSSISNGVTTTNTFRSTATALALLVSASAYAAPVPVWAPA